MTGAPPPFLDTNVLVYAFSDDPRATTALGLVSAPFVVGVQTLNEFAAVAHRKLGLGWPEVEQGLGHVERLAADVLPTVPADLHRALALARRHNLSFYDALMLAIAIGAGCETFLSEDMHDGLVLENRLTIRDPFRRGIT